MTTQPPKKTPVFWFAIRVIFTCPECKRENTEVMYSHASTSDPSKIATATQTQNLKCKFCKAQLADGTQVNVTVLPITLEQAKAAGFNPPPGTPGSD
jgi:ribosomal protein S27E